MENGDSQSLFDGFEKLLAIPLVSDCQDPEPRTEHSDDKLTHILKGEACASCQNPLPSTTECLSLDPELPDDDLFASAYAEVSLNATFSEPSYNFPGNIDPNALPGAINNVPCDIGTPDTSNFQHEVPNLFERQQGGYFQPMQFPSSRIPNSPVMSDNQQESSLCYATMSDQQSHDGFSDCGSYNMIGMEKERDFKMSRHAYEAICPGKLYNQTCESCNPNFRDVYRHQVRSHNAGPYHSSFGDAYPQHQWNLEAVRPINGDGRDSGYNARQLNLRRYNLHPFKGDVAWHDNMAVNNWNPHGVAVIPWNSYGHFLMDKKDKISCNERIWGRAYHGYDGRKLGINGIIMEKVSQNHLKMYGGGLPHGSCTRNLSSLGVERDKYVDSRFLGMWTNFRNKIHKELPSNLDEVEGRIYAYAKDKNGCLLLQKAITDKPERIELILDEILDRIVELMMHPSASCLIQDVLSVCSDIQRMKVLRVIVRRSVDLAKICCNQYGSRVIRKVFKILEKNELRMLLTALKPYMSTLMKNFNGSLVAESCLKDLTRQSREFVLNEASKDFNALARDRLGCRFLQECIRKSDGEHDELLHKIVSNALKLSEDPYGNYVVQCLFELKNEWPISGIVRKLNGNYAELSMGKCSSNVVEKCLEHPNDTFRARVSGELIWGGRLLQVMQNEYGNYVIQTALRNLTGHLYIELVEAVWLHRASLEINPFGRRILSSVDRNKYSRFKAMTNAERQPTELQEHYL